MTWCKSYGCRNSRTDRNEFCVSCVQMLARAEVYEDKWPNGAKDRSVDT